MKKSEFQPKISPSQFMRELRPEYYSDTEDRVAYLLDAPILEYHLESITQRNQTHNFELFCRKLCERVICPNLRPQTGPEGGGDSKADTETYPVSDEITSLIYEGEVNAGKERWAFAFSAKKKWAEKVRDDVKGIIETGRKYNKIFFVTSKFSRAKDRSRIEDELTGEFNIPITIHDRSWIVMEIIEKNRMDLAFNYLGIGEKKSDPLRLGPTDYSRARQLKDIEDSFDDPTAFIGMEQQQVTEALVAAKLSRNMERPRTETDGRFLRAVRLAKKYGTYRQKLETHYEFIWTAFWWFDDFEFLNEHYTSFETLALQSNHAINLEFLCNLNQLLVNSIIHGLMSYEECRFHKRTNNLIRALEKSAEEKNRPNNRLEAQTSLLLIRMNQAYLEKDSKKLTTIWHDFSSILEKAKGLGEFNANRLVSLVEVAGPIAGNDTVYNGLVEKMADFVAQRKSEAEGALILVQRAQQLGFSENLDMIRFLGKAAIGLTKEEYSDHLIEALSLLALAYRSAGLLWAARASCMFVAASLVMASEKESEMPVRIIPILKLWAWISLELRHLPDFLYAIQVLNGCLATLSLTENSKVKVREDVMELELALGSYFLNLRKTDLQKLEKIPDILDSLCLLMTRSALLYNLGHIDTLRGEGSLPDMESDEEVNNLFSKLASQPVSKQIQGHIILNDGNPQMLCTKIYGMTVEVKIEGGLQSILVAELILSSLEAFFATVLEQRIIPHTERMTINIIENEETIQPSFRLDEMNMKGNLVWPIALSPTNFEKQIEIKNFLLEVSSHVLSTAFIVQDIDTLLKKLFEDEAAHNRISMVANAPNSYHRVTSKYVSRIDDWKDYVEKSYEIKKIRPTLNQIELKKEKKVETISSTQHQSGTSPLKDHRELEIRSVIDIHAWNQACWKGAAYTQVSIYVPPYMAFIFENEKGARRIFERWIERFSTQDKKEEISLSIIRRLPKQNKHHYCMHITSNYSECDEKMNGRQILMTSRFKIMEPNSDINLERFLASYSQFKAFFLLPAIMKRGRPDLLFDLSILKHDISIKQFKDIGSNDIEALSIRKYLNL